MAWTRKRSEPIIILSEKENLSTLFEEKIEKYYLSSIVDRVKEYFGSL